MGRTRWAQAAFGRAPWKTELFQAPWLWHGAEPLHGHQALSGGAGMVAKPPGQAPSCCADVWSRLEAEAWLPWEPRA